MRISFSIMKINSFYAKYIFGVLITLNIIWNFSFFFGLRACSDILKISCIQRSKCFRQHLSLSTPYFAPFLVNSLLILKPLFFNKV